MTTPTRVVIVIRGGLLEAVYLSDPTLDATLLDYDNAELEDAPMDPEEMEAEEARLTEGMTEVLSPLVAWRVSRSVANGGGATQEGRTASILYGEPELSAKASTPFVLHRVGRSWLIDPRRWQASRQIGDCA